MTRTLTATQLRAALAAHTWREMPTLPGRTNHLRAGVLVPVVWDPEPRVVATRRPTHMARHAGEVCFPGGRSEPHDVDLMATARREAAEELGIHEADVLGRLSSLPLLTSDYRLEPWVARIAADVALVPDPGEVAAIYHLPLAALLDAAEIAGAPYTTQQGERRLCPYFAMPDAAVMYGATALVLWELVTVAAAALERSPPRLVEGALGWSDLLPPR